MGLSINYRTPSEVMAVAAPELLRPVTLSPHGLERNTPIPRKTSSHLTIVKRDASSAAGRSLAEFVSTVQSGVPQLVGVR